MAAQVVSFHCVLKNNLGRVLGKTFNQDVLLGESGNEEFLKGLLAGLQGLQTGEKRRVCLRAEQAYGYYDLNLILELPIDKLNMSKKISLGEKIIFSQKGEEKFYRVIALNDDSVTLDGNHPLAGQDLVFEIEATQTREATIDDFAEPDSGQMQSFRWIYFFYQ